MRHLFSSRVSVLRLELSSADGMASYAYVPVAGMDSVPCRLDLNFLRPGKDQPTAPEAGKAPDRIGVMFCDATVAIRAGDRFRAVAGPVTGVFEIRQTPDKAVDYSSAHHIEVQIVEVAQQTLEFT